ncbi:hypothetical protein CSQ96_20385 [Janthinobacterium sp. BJB412]|nr:hypothetical protein CSQ96_20385 [Janthinobacterium sp. BJB412]
MTPPLLPGQTKAAAASVIALPYWLREFGQIRLAALALAGAVGLGAAAVLATQWYRQQAADQLAQAGRTRAAAYARLADGENEKREIRLYQPRFVTLRQRGLVGEENRLDWVEAVRQVQEQRKLLPLNYEIAPQRPVQAEPGLELGEYRLRASRMRLHMDLLHEADLFGFLDELKRRGYFAVQDCSVKRQVAQNVANTANLSADCAIEWLTLAPAEAAAPAPPPQKGSQ